MECQSARSFLKFLKGQGESIDYPPNKNFDLGTSLKFIGWWWVGKGRLARWETRCVPNRFPIPVAVGQVSGGDPFCWFCWWSGLTEIRWPEQTPAGFSLAPLAASLVHTSCCSQLWLGIQAKATDPCQCHLRQAPLSN